MSIHELTLDLFRTPPNKARLQQFNFVQQGQNFAASDLESANFEKTLDKTKIAAIFCRHEFTLLLGV